MKRLGQGGTVLPLPMTANGSYSDGMSMAGAEPNVVYSVYTSAAPQPYPHITYFSSQPPPIPPVQANNGPEPLRTVLINGFPQDVKERELHNLLLFVPGYQASVMNFDEDTLQGKAIFATSVQAEEAVMRIDGKVEFDSGYMLKAVMATENLKLENDSAPKRTQSDDKLGTVVASPPPYSTANGAVMSFAPYPYPAAGPHLVSTPRSYAPVKNEKDNPPCNTLFIGNLGEGVDENELRAAFSAQPGFQQLKVVRGPRGISAFIEFADVTTACAAHETQQGLIMDSSDRGPIRVQFSKNPFGRKRDTGINVNGGSLASMMPPQPYPPFAMTMPQALLQGAYTGPHAAMYGTTPAGAPGPFIMTGPLAVPVPADA